MEISFPLSLKGQQRLVGQRVVAILPTLVFLARNMMHLALYLVFFAVDLSFMSYFVKSILR